MGSSMKLSITGELICFIAFNMIVSTALHGEVHRPSTYAARVTLDQLAHSFAEKAEAEDSIIHAENLTIRHEIEIAQNNWSEATKMYHNCQKFDRYETDQDFDNLTRDVGKVEEQFKLLNIRGKKLQIDIININKLREKFDINNRYKHGTYEYEKFYESYYDHYHNFRIKWHSVVILPTHSYATTYIDAAKRLKRGLELCSKNYDFEIMLKRSNWEFAKLFENLIHAK